VTVRLRGNDRGGNDRSMTCTISATLLLADMSVLAVSAAAQTTPDPGLCLPSCTRPAVTSLFFESNLNFPTQIPNSTSELNFRTQLQNSASELGFRK
jgi:hypothetical protein